MCRVAETVSRSSEPPAARRDRRAGAGSSSPRARAPGRRRCSSSASCARSVDEGLDVESMLVITYTRARRRRAARAHPSAARRAWAARPRARARRRLDLDHPRVLQAAAEGESASPRGSIRGSACSTTRRRACSGARRSTRAHGVLRRSTSRSGCALLATYGAGGLRRMLTGVYETLRSAGRELVLELGDAAAAARRSSTSSRAAPRRSPRTRTRPTCSGPPPRPRSRSSPPSRCPSACSTSRRRAGPRRAGRELRGGA